MTEQKTNKIAPAYVSFTTFRNLLDRLHQTTVPTYIERDVMGSSMNGGVYGHLKAALKFLGLIGEDGKTTPTLDALAAADTEERKQLLAEILKERYSFLYGKAAADFNISKATTPELRRKFEGEGIRPEVAKKSMSFFVQAAQYANLPLSTHIYKPKTFTARSRSGRQSTDGRGKSQPNGNTEPYQTRQNPPASGVTDAEIDAFVKRILRQPLPERKRLFEQVRIAMRYAEFFGDEE